LIRLVLKLDDHRISVLVMEQGRAQDLHALVGLRDDERLGPGCLGASLDDLGLVLGRLAGGEGDPRQHRQ
jgi:hypothetical protein